jgi:hypothetical protein
MGRSATSIADLNEDGADDDEQDTGSQDPSVVCTGARQRRGRLRLLSIDLAFEGYTFCVGQGSQVNDPGARVDDNHGVHRFCLFLTIGRVGRQRRIGLCRLSGRQARGGR